MTRANWRQAIFVALAVAGSTVLAWQWRIGLALQSEVDRLRAQNTRIEPLRAENKRLQAGQVSVAELAALRADHAELVQLRAALQQLEAKTQAGFDAAATKAIRLP
jgi:predicted metal-binding membrane protein